jgi:hypothetical protein
MLGFVIPVAPKRSCSDWLKSTTLLRKTVISVLNQSSSAFKIYIIYEDEPKINISSNKITTIQMDLRHLKASDMSDYQQHVQKYFKKGYDDIMLNKGMKLTRGCAEALRNGCTHVMCLDSDDLVSDGLAAFVKEQPNEPGWHINRGYLWNERSWIIRRHNEITGINGSSHIIRTDLIPCDFHSNIFYDYTLFESHGYTKTRITREYNEQLKPLPFRGVIVVIHGDNASKSYFASRTSLIKSMVKILFFGQFLDKKIKREFRLNND